MLATACVGLLSLPVAFATWWLNVRSAGILPLLVLSADYWLLFFVLLLPFIAAVGLITHDLSHEVVAGVAFLFFGFWFVRMEPPHQFLSAQPHISVHGLFDLLLIGLATIIFYALGTQRRARFRLVSVLILLSASVGLEAFARFESPSRDRADAVRQVASAVKAPVASPGVPAKRVLVIGIDGWDWRVIAELIRLRRLPALERLSHGAALYQLDNLAMHVSPEIWTSVYTGVGSRTSGVDSFLRWTFAGIREPIIELPKIGFHSVWYHERLLWYLRGLHLWSARPVSNQDVTPPPIWTILASDSNQQRRLAVIEPFPMQLVPEHLPGVFITLRHTGASIFSESKPTRFALPEHRSDLPGPLIQEEHDRVGLVSQILRDSRYDSVIYYTHFLDQVQHLAWDYQSPGCIFCGDAGGPINMDKFLRSPLGRGYIEADHTIDVLVRSFGEPATTILVSDHGWDYSDYKHFTSPYGVLVIAPANATGYRGIASVLRVAPTFLTLAGMAPATNMAMPLDVGQPLFPPKDYSGVVHRTFFDLSRENDELMKELRAVGYIGN